MNEQNMFKTLENLFDLHRLCETWSQAYRRLGFRFNFGSAWRIPRIKESTIPSRIHIRNDENDKKLNPDSIPEKMGSDLENWERFGLRRVLIVD